MKVNKSKTFKALYSAIAIILCLATGYVIHNVMGGLPPALYGLVVMTFFLKYQLINASYLEQTMQWIFRHMGVCFVPAGVGIIEHYELVVQYGLLLVAITFFTTIMLLTFVGLFVSRSEKRSTQ